MQGLAPLCYVLYYILRRWMNLRNKAQLSLPSALGRAKRCWRHRLEWGDCLSQDSGSIFFLSQCPATLVLRQKYRHLEYKGTFDILMTQVISCSSHVNTQSGILEFRNSGLVVDMWWTIRWTTSNIDKRLTIYLIKKSKRLPGTYLEMTFCCYNGHFGRYIPF